MSYVALLEFVPIALSGISALIAAASLRRRTKSELDFIKFLSEKSKEQEVGSLFTSLKEQLASEQKPNEELLNKYFELTSTALKMLPKDEQNDISKALTQSSERGRLSYIYDSLLEVQEFANSNARKANK